MFCVSVTSFRIPGFLLLLCCAIVFRPTNWNRSLSSYNHWFVSRIFFLLVGRIFPHSCPTVCTARTLNFQLWLIVLVLRYYRQRRERNIIWTTNTWYRNEDWDEASMFALPTNPTSNPIYLGEYSHFDFVPATALCFSVENIRHSRNERPSAPINNWRESSCILIEYEYTH